MTTITTAATDDYPVRFDVDYPEGPRNRVTVFFRLILVIPIAVLLMLLSGGPGTTWRNDDGGAGDARVPLAQFRDRVGDRMPGFGAIAGDRSSEGGGRVSGASGAAAGGGIVIAPTVLMLLFRRKYPRWWFDWNRELYRFGNRVGAYLLLLRDEYPSTDEEQAVHLDIDYPDAQQLSRWLPLVKWLLAIPHYILLVLLSVGVFFAVLFAWFAIIVTGRFPRGLFDFVVGVGRWGVRVSGYAFLLVTDRYPPFSTR
jgi:hypothetical protein